MAGETEQSVAAAGIDYVVGRARYTDNPRGCIIGEQEGFLKLIFSRPDLKLIGVHAIGEHASELVHIGLLAMTAGCDATVLSSLSFNVPTLGALYQDATWRLINEESITAGVNRGHRAEIELSMCGLAAESRM